MKKTWLWLILFLGLAACSQKVIVTLDMNPTLPTPTLWLATADQTLPTLAPPTSVPEAVSQAPTDFSPVLFGKKYEQTVFLLLGGASRDGWLQPDVSMMRFAGEATYSLHTLEQEYKYFFWGRAPEALRTCNGYFVGTDATPDEVGMVAVLDGWNITKRAPTELGADGAFYQQVVLDWLKSQNVAAPQLGTLQIFRVDLEGDGVDEIFLNATLLDESQHMTRAGDYSIVLMRKVNGNEAVTVPLLADVYSASTAGLTFPNTYSIGNFIDLNQDSVLEVVVSIQKWEGFGGAVYQIDGQSVKEALRAEC